MNHLLFRRLIQADFENLLDALSMRQHLSPHEPLAEALSRTMDPLGVCPKAVEQAVRWLQLDLSTRIGRLRRTELMQLARSIHRFWRQSAPAETIQPQS